MNDPETGDRALWSQSGQLFGVVERIVAARQREWENAVLRECVENMPATGDCADFMSVVSTAMLALRLPPGPGSQGGVS